MTYRVLARTWRPQTFGDLLGQEAVVQTLQNALAAGTIGHAYLFSGLRGVGKTTVARLLAKAVNCEQGPTAEPCGECVSCGDIAAGSSLDMVELDGASNRGIDDVRELRELLRYRPSRDRYRVIIIDEVHMLTREAFNALLKSLEEPPPHILFVLATTERHRVPATILSRCQQLEFRPVGSEPIVHRMLEIAGQEGFELSRSAADTISRAAEGSVRDALSLLDQLRAFSGDDIDDESVATVLGVPRFEVMVELVEALIRGDARTGLDLLRGELVAGHDPTVLFHEAGRVLRSLAHLAVDPELEVTLTEDHRQRLIPIASAHGADALSRMLGLWLEQEALLRDASNRELTVEVASLRLARWPTVQRAERLLAGGTLDSPPFAPNEPPSTSHAPTDQTPPDGSLLDPQQRLTQALWQRQPQLAGAVESADVKLEDDRLVLRFEDRSEPLAQYLDSQAREELEATSRSVFDGVGRVDVEVNQNEGGAGVSRKGLEREAGDDPQVQMALKVLGGEIVAVRPDREVE